MGLVVAFGLMTLMVFKRPAISIEWDAGAQRATRSCWSRCLEHGDIQKITLETVKEWANMTSGVDSLVSTYPVPGMVA